MRRAAVSVPSNIAEGKGRYSKKELVQFLFHARGSLLELETQLSIVHDLKYMDSVTFCHFEGKTQELGRILNGRLNRFSSAARAGFLRPDT
jgi:four helix bundle protein